MPIAFIRAQYHRNLCNQIIRLKFNKKGQPYPNFADADNRSSRVIAASIVKIIGYELGRDEVKEQTAGERFEHQTKEFIRTAFSEIGHLRPGEWLFSTRQTEISRFEQYEHLGMIERIIRNDIGLSTTFGGDYIVTPDIIVARRAVSDDEINQNSTVITIEDNLVRFSPLRSINRPEPAWILHASISCKWTIRSDRSQNTRTEALNLIRNRKGPLPHIVVVTAEPLPTRLATLALGTGDIDCVYHFALPELQVAIQELDNQDQQDMLNAMIEGRRLRDISDLPFDLAI